MNRLVDLVESTPTFVDLTPAEAQTIASLGRAMASKSTWWGATAIQDGEAERRTAISCFSLGGARYSVTVGNAVGAFGVGNTTFLVAPKIPMSHLLFLFSRAGYLPRIDRSPVVLGRGEGLWELMALWFLNETGLVIQRDLLRDYQSNVALVPSLRGQLDAIPSAQLYYAGTLDLVCTYDEFTVDNSYNRVLLRALRLLQGLANLTLVNRRAARVLSSHFSDVGEFTSSDLSVQLDRRSAYYESAIILAKLIIEACTLSISEGIEGGWSFLIRTPDAVEEGIKATLDDALSPTVRVRKYGTQLSPAPMRIDPDLRFDGVSAVGDVKYKKFGTEWPRGDLYQSVAFAAGTGMKKACVVSFAGHLEKRLSPVWFGDIEVTNLVWHASDTVEPNAASLQLGDDCKEWLGI